MTHFTPAGPGHPARFAHGKRWEVVMEEEPLVCLAFEQVHALLVVGRPERCGYKRLGFAASEHGGAVSSRKQSGFDPDRADLVEASLVGPFALVEDMVAENPFFEFIERTFDQVQL